MKEHTGANPAQEAAISHKDGPMMVLAGPGSGKTFTITRRVLALIEKYGVPAEHILVISFTRAAAAEMQQRFESLYGRASDARFGTFHSVYFQIVKEARRYKSTDILSEAEKRRYLKEALSCAPELPDDDASMEALLSEFSVLKNDGLGPEAYREDRGLYPREVFTAVFNEYMQILDQEHKLDFDDMLLKCRELFCEDPAVLRRWQEQYRYILIDEFQDINPLQYEVLKLLAEPRRNLFIVGDDDQSIYGFRSAAPRIMLDFPRDYPELKRLVLSDNYRSGADIVQCALKLVGHNTERYKKRLKAVRGGGRAVYIQGFDERAAEAEAVVGLLKEAAGRVKYRDIAMLFRTHAGARYYSQALAGAAIPFYIKDKTTSAFSTEYGKDILAVMAYAHGDHSRKNLLRFMNKPARYIRRSLLVSEQAELCELVRSQGVGREAAANIRLLIQQLSQLKSLPVYAALMYFRKSMGYELWLKEEVERKGLDESEAMEILQAVCDSAREYESYREWLLSIAAYERRLKESEKAGDADAVQLLTMHASKGLEYRLVILCDINEGNIPQRKAKEPEQLAEERRLLYVAMTRARDKLFIFYEKKHAGGRVAPSRFIKELQ